MKIIWKKQYSVGIKEIDDQHKQFIKIINKIYKSTEKENYVKGLVIALCELGDYALYHFSAEEVYFKKFNYKHAARHIKEHDMFRQQISAWVADSVFSRKRLLLLKLIADFSAQWLIAHIAKEDTLYLDCFKKNGLSK